MKKAPFLFASLLTLAIAGCKSTEAPAPGSGLEGTWRLTSRQCYCTPTPVSDEAVTFTATRFTFYKDGQLGRAGEYSFTAAAPYCGGSAAPGLHLEFPPTNLAPTEVQYRLNGNTLVLDYGGPCDAPVDTYERVRP